MHGSPEYPRLTGNAATFICLGMNKSKLAGDNLGEHPGSKRRMSWYRRVLSVTERLGGGGERQRAGRSERTFNSFAQLPKALSARAKKSRKGVIQGKFTPGEAAGLQ